jgi:Cu-Zn family superoxide dismutase
MTRKHAIVGGAVGLIVVIAVSAIAPASSARSDAVARLKDVNGDFVGVVQLSRTDEGKVAISVRKAENIQPAGEFHGFHVHTTGECDPDAVDPATGETVPFYSAGGHFNPDSGIHGDHAGDLPTLLVNDDGTAELRFVTDRFRLKDLFDDDGSAVIVHAGRDNFANIPATAPDDGRRYHSHLEDVFGPDSLTEATGDAGSRFACGVVRRT